MKVWKMYDALKMLQISIITLHVGFLTAMLEIYFFLTILCCSNHQLALSKTSLKYSVYCSKAPNNK